MKWFKRFERRKRFYFAVEKEAGKKVLDIPNIDIELASGKIGIKATMSCYFNIHCGHTPVDSGFLYEGNTLTLNLKDSDIPLLDEAEEAILHRGGEGD